jgi:hypothetical protein
MWLCTLSTSTSVHSRGVLLSSLLFLPLPAPAHFRPELQLERKLREEETSRYDFSTRTKEEERRGLQGRRGKTEDGRQGESEGPRTEKARGRRGGPPHPWRMTLLLSRRQGEGRHKLQTHLFTLPPSEKEENRWKRRLWHQAQMILLKRTPQARSWTRED